MSCKLFKFIFRYVKITSIIYDEKMEFIMARLICYFVIMGFPSLVFSGLWVLLS